VAKDGISRVKARYYSMESRNEWLFFKTKNDQGSKDPFNKAALVDPALMRQPIHVYVNLPAVGKKPAEMFVKSQVKLQIQFLKFSNHGPDCLEKMMLNVHTRRKNQPEG